MIVLAALVLFCGAIGLSSLQLSPTAGHVPAAVAVLTLLPILLQARLDFLGRGAARHKSGDTAPMSFLLLPVLLYLAGFFVALPLYAGWCLRIRPGFALISMALVLAMLVLLHQHVAVYSGLVWDLMASAAV